MYFVLRIYMDFGYNIVMSISGNTMPRPEVVIIKIKNDPGRYTDVVKVLHAKDFFRKVWELKQTFDPTDEYPITDRKKALSHFNEKYWGTLESDYKNKFPRLIYDLRQDYGLSPHYERLIHKLIFTGVIEDTDYKKAYYTTLPKYYSNDPDDFEEIDVIVLHQGTRTEDLEKPLREFLSFYEVKTKTSNSLMSKGVSEMPDSIKSYILDSRYNKALSYTPIIEIEKYYPYYQRFVLFGDKPLDMALKAKKLSKKFYLKTKKEPTDEDKYLLDDIKSEAKSISHAIARIKKLISPE